MAKIGMFHATSLRILFIENLKNIVLRETKYMNDSHSGFIFNFEKSCGNDDESTIRKRNLLYLDLVDGKV